MRPQRAAIAGDERCARRFRMTKAVDPANRINDGRFDRNERDRQPEDGQRHRRQKRNVDGHADRHEKEPEQQALERLYVRFEFVAELRIGEQHAGKKGTQRHRQPHRNHE